MDRKSSGFGGRHAHSRWARPQFHVSFRWNRANRFRALESGVHGKNGAEMPKNDPYRLACLAAGIGVWDWDLLSDEITLSLIARKIQGLPERVR